MSNLRTSKFGEVNKKVLIIVGIVVTIILAAVSGYLLYRHYKKNNSNSTESKFGVMNMNLGEDEYCD